MLGMFRLNASTKARGRPSHNDVRTKIDEIERISGISWRQPNKWTWFVNWSFEMRFSRYFLWSPSPTIRNSVSGAFFWIKEQALRKSPKFFWGLKAPMVVTTWDFLRPKSRLKLSVFNFSALFRANWSNQNQKMKEELHDQENEQGGEEEYSENIYSRHKQKR